MKTYYVYSECGQQTVQAESFDDAAEQAGAPDQDLIDQGAYMVIRDEDTYETREYGDVPR